MKYSHIATPPSSMEEQLIPTKTLKPINSKKISISMLVISLPLLYVSLLHVPPSNLLKDTAFWFLISNSIIVIVAADSGVFSPSSHDPTDDLYDEYVKRSRPTVPTAATMHSPPEVNVNEEGYCPEVIKHVQTTSSAVVVHQKESSNESTHDQNLTVIVNPKDSTKFGRSRSEMAAKNRDVVTNKKSLRRSATEKRGCRVEGSEYWRMSDEELNKRVEDFIRKFNREIRLQEQ